MAYSSKGLITVSKPVRTSRFVPGSIRLAAFVSGTNLTVTTIFKWARPPQTQRVPRVRCTVGRFEPGLIAPVPGAPLPKARSRLEVLVLGRPVRARLLFAPRVDIGFPVDRLTAAPRSRGIDFVQNLGPGAPFHLGIL